MQPMRLPIAASSTLLLLAVAGLARSVAADGATLGLGTIALFGSQATVGVTLDGLSSVLLAFVAGLGLITALYSRRNLRGQPRLRRYALLHTTATASLGLMVTASSLPLMAAGWTVSGLAVAGLISHRGTTAAQRAARTVRRRLLASDALIFAAVATAAAGFTSLDRADLTASAAAADGLLLQLTALLLVAAAVVRSALAPSHRWLFETAEAPSPVSALLHAGVVNAVGIMGVLVWPVLAAAPAARGALIVIGTGTAVAMTLTMAYRADIKGKLAASTSAQMGYLAVQVGLGLPLAGLLHLIGHGAYKAHLFMRAGGEISRARTNLAGARHAHPRTVAAAVVLACAAALLGLAAWPSVPLADALPIGAATATAAVGLTAVFAPGAGLASLVARRSQVLAATTVAALVAGHIAFLGWWSNAFPGFAAAASAWSQPAVALWLGLVALSAVATVVILHRLRSGRLPVLRSWLATTALPPGARLANAGSRQAVAAPSATAETLPAEVAVDAVRGVVGPMWPLHSAVAANPLEGLQGLPFIEAADVAAATWGASALPRRAEHLRAYASGRITDADIRAAAARAGDATADYSPSTVAAVLIAVSRAQDEPDPALHAETAELLGKLPEASLARLDRAATPVRPAETRTEIWDRANPGRGTGMPLTAVADAHANTWLLDLLAAPDRSPHGPGGLWLAWRSRIAAPGMDRTLGVRGFAAAVGCLPQDPGAALGVLLQDVPAEEHIGYLGRLLARNPGWAGHLAWQAHVGRPDLRSDLLALRAAYDVLLVRASGGILPQLQRPAAGPSTRLIAATSAALRALGHDSASLRGLVPAEVEGVASLAAAMSGRPGDAILLAASEQRYRNPVVDRIGARAAFGPDAGEAVHTRVAMCIDVRSERLRRHLESDAGIGTYGFAGFFGLAVRHVPSAGRASDQCPVLLRPACELEEELAVLGTANGTARLLGRAALAASAAPVAPFALAEAAAGVSGGLVLAQTLAPRAFRALRDGARGSALELRGDLGVAASLTAEQQTDAAAGFLHAVGLHAVDGDLLVIAGHAAAVENNAYAAAYECGACGGNGGYINARMMADILNRADVRSGLAARGIVLAEGLAAVPALHITTTDDLHIDDRDVPDGAQEAVSRLRLSAAAARATSVIERSAALPGGRIEAALVDVERRSADWAEATPEWGLSGNAMFVAGPRWMTRGIALHGRAFLHSYDPAADPDRAVLRSILTAPMVVAHMINSQYYASAVDPLRFGAQDKTTHNAVSDFAVLSGAHGDIRVGLPWQSLFDADPHGRRPSVAHEPMRLQVLLHAPAADVLHILLDQPDVLRLVTGEWLSIAVVEPADGGIRRLTPALAWETWDTDPIPVGPTPAAGPLGSLDRAAGPV